MFEDPDDPTDQNESDPGTDEGAVPDESAPPAQEAGGEAPPAEEAAPADESAGDGGEKEDEG